jgi:phospholipid/cholesterol/gamma-HCH transport system substrate-binding protein
VKRQRLQLEIKRARGGFLAVLALAALTIGAMFIIAGGLRLNMPWTSTYTARVAVDDAKGVVPGKQQVRISGLPVGKITKAELVDGRPVLTLTLKGKYAPLYRDARLRLRPKTPLDDLYLNVESRGHTSAGKIGKKDVLVASRTIVPVDIGRVFNAFNGDTRTRLEQATDELGQALPDHGVELRETLVKLTPFLLAAQRLSRETAERRGYTRRLVHNFSLMMGELGNRDAQLRGLVRGGSATFQSLAAAERPLADVFEQLPPTLQQLQPSFQALRETADELDPAFDELRGSARQLPSGLAALRDFSAEATPALRDLRKPLPSLGKLVGALAPTAQGLDRAFARLAPTAPRLDRITKAIVPCELAVQKFFANTISLMKFSDARGLIPRGQTVDGTSGMTAAPSCAAGGPRK